MSGNICSLPTCWQGPSTHEVLEGSQTLTFPSQKGRSHGRCEGWDTHTPTITLGQSREPRTPTSQFSRDFYTGAGPGSPAAYENSRVGAQFAIGGGFCQVPETLDDSLI